MKESTIIKTTQMPSIAKLLGNIVVASVSDLKIFVENTGVASTYPGEISVTRGRNGFFGSYKRTDVYFVEDRPDLNPLFSVYGRSALEEILNKIGEKLGYGSDKINIVLHNKKSEDFRGWRNMPPIPVLCCATELHRNVRITEDNQRKAFRKVLAICKIIFS